MVAALERCATLDARDPVGRVRLAAVLWDRAYHEDLPPGARAAYVRRGLAHAEAALDIDANDLSALVYRGLLLRVAAADAEAGSERGRLLREAEAAGARVVEARKAGAAARPDPHGALFPIRRPERPAPRPAPVRVGGPIKEPKRVKAVEPDYPSVAQSARVQGVVVLDCLIGEDGAVKYAKVLRGNPFLDQAALDAVMKWRYEPTIVDGKPVPVVMTVTVNFRLH
jgi:TonB family protein